MSFADCLTLQPFQGSACTWIPGFIVAIPLQAPSDHPEICQRSLLSNLAGTGSAGSAYPQLGYGSSQSQQQMLPKTAHVRKMAEKTLLVSNLPRCATEHDVQTAFAVAGISSSCFVNITREGSKSKCFGIVRFPTCNEAQAAMLACSNGEIAMKDLSSKAKLWVVKANWANCEVRDVQKDKRGRNHAKAKGGAAVAVAKHQPLHRNLVFL